MLKSSWQAEVTMCRSHDVHVLYLSVYSPVLVHWLIFIHLVVLFTCSEYIQCPVLLLSLLARMFFPFSLHSIIFSFKFVEVENDFLAFFFFSPHHKVLIALANISLL